MANRKPKYWVLSVCFLTILFSTHAQQESNFIRLRPVNNNEIVKISSTVEDGYGFIWLKHESGFLKYGGDNYNHISFEEIFGSQFTEDRGYKIHSDGHGNIWVSSFGGELTRIHKDGLYLSFRDNLEGKQIFTISSKNDKVWFGSNDGKVYEYNYISSEFKCLATLPSDGTEKHKIQSIAFTENEDLWIGTIKGKIYKYSPANTRLTIIENPFSIYSQEVHMTTDQKNRVWVATERHGMLIYDPVKNAFKAFVFPTKLAQHNNLFIHLICDSFGFIWAATDGDGLYRINPKSGEVNHFEHNEANESSLFNNTILHINEDSHHNIWVVTKAGNVDVLPKIVNKIKHHSGTYDQSVVKTLSILQASDGTIWTGTDGMGLNKLMGNGTNIQYNPESNGKHFFYGKFIQSLVEDNSNHIWIGTYQNGLWVLNAGNDNFQKIHISTSDGVEATDVRHVFMDSKDRIWTTTNVGIFVFSTDKELLGSFNGHDNGLYGDISQSICEDENGTIWVAINNGGLFAFEDPKADSHKFYFTKHLYYKKEDNDHSNYNICSMASDGNGQIWLVTISGILIKFDINNKTYHSYREEDKFNNSNLTAVLVEDVKNIWLSSNNGIIHFKPIEGTATTYYREDGLSSNTYTLRSAFKGKDRYLYFGGQNGLNFFLPSEMKKEPTSAELYISNIEILNQPAQTIVPEQFADGIMRVNSLNLNYKQSSFSFDFSALSNVLHSHFHYAYRLKGFDEDWIIPNQNLTATYTNIPFGKYAFEVKAGMKKGDWNIPSKSIAIQISPPWWQSPWAYLFYFIAFALIAYSLINWFRLKNKLAKEEWQHKKEKELYAMKMNFFTKMSHEIQTPLTLILGPLEDMLARVKEEKNSVVKNRLIMIAKNARRLSRIAMQLTSARNKELGVLEINPNREELVSDLKNICHSFEEQAAFRQIKFTQEYPDDDLWISYDQEMLEHVIYNLLSNAFKFTPKDGRVNVAVKKDTSTQEVLLSVKDSGCGISKQELDKVFTLFYQTENGKQEKGTGIGLALTKEIVELHNGKIEVDSSADGTCFTIRLPIDETIVPPMEKPITNTRQDLELVSNHDLTTKNSSLLPLAGHANNDKRSKTILIVEDNFEMQLFLQNVFAEKYNVLFADNGKEGIAITEKFRPNLIISDVMMPKVNGIEMSKILQKKKTTQHIPIILMSANNKHNIKIMGLKSGAVEYLHKPFNVRELILKVENFITRSENIISKYKTERLAAPEQLNGQSPDEIFLEKLVNEINQQLDNENFILKDLSTPMNMSYSAIYRKCQSITGKSLVEFVRYLRLKKAALLFIEHDHKISEAAYMAGFSNPKYFSKCFKNEFGKSPNEFKREAQKMGVKVTLEKFHLTVV